MALGDTVGWEATNLDGEPVKWETTALHYRQPVTADVPATEATGKEGVVWAELEILQCSIQGRILADATSWQLSYGSTPRLETSKDAPGVFDDVAYVFDPVLEDSECTRNKLAYAVPEGKRPRMAVLAAYKAEPVGWTIPAK